MVQKKKLYIDGDLFEVAKRVIKENDPALYESYYQDKRGGDSRLFNYFVRKLVSDCLGEDLRGIEEK